MYTAFTIALVVVGIAFLYRARRRRFALEAACATAFEESFATLQPKPSYSLTYSYSFPAFTITFADAEQLAAAKTGGHVARFSEAIGELCKNEGTSSRPFDATVAIYFTHKGNA